MRRNPGNRQTAVRVHGWKHARACPGGKVRLYEEKLAEPQRLAVLKKTRVAQKLLLAVSCTCVPCWLSSFTGSTTRTLRGRQGKCAKGMTGPWPALQHDIGNKRRHKFWVHRLRVHSKGRGVDAGAIVQLWPVERRRSSTMPSLERFPMGQFCILSNHPLTVAEC